MSDVRLKMAQGIAWMSLMRLGVKGLGLVSTMVLARLLVPADFGVVAMAMSIVATLELFSTFSFDLALIQRQDSHRQDYDTAWTFNVMFAASLAAILLIATIPAAYFYNEPRLRGVMPALAGGVLVFGFENIGVVAFRKELVFHKEFAMRIAQKIGTTAVTLPLAFWLRSYWALVIGIVTGNIIAVLISYYAHPFRPRFSLVSASRLFSFSKWLAVNNVLWFFRDRFPDFLLGRIAGATALGLYSISYEISYLPTAEIVAPINRAVLPVYAKMAGDLDQLRRGFLDVMGLIALLALPAGFGIAATAPLIVNVALGAKWAPAAAIVSILGVVGALTAIQTNCGNIHYAMGRPKTMTFVAGIQLVTLMPVLIWGALTSGAIGIAIAYLASNALVALPLNYWLVVRRLELALPRLLSLLWRPILATASMYWVTSVFVSAHQDQTIWTLLLGVALGAGCYAAVILVLWLLAGRPPGPEQTIVVKALSPAWRRVRLALRPSGSGVV